MGGNGGKQWAMVGQWGQFTQLSSQGKLAAKFASD